MAKHMTTTKIDFLGYRYICFALSLLLLASFIGGAWYKYSQRGSVFLYSVDFTGGTQVLLDFSRPTTPEIVKQALEARDFSGIEARAFSNHEILVRVKDFSSDSQGLGKKITETLEGALTETNVSVLQIDRVSAGVGAELSRNSLWAVVFSLIGMLLYLGYRFWSFSYGIGSVVALMHDVLVIMSFILWFDYEISMNVIGAVLFILGYSVNDTIVIFARIRENLASHKNLPVIDVMNLSINETLRRSLLTSFATALMVVALVMFGGEVLRLLSVSVLIGIVFGTYSSIYVASPVMLLFYKEPR